MELTIYTGLLSTAEYVPGEMVLMDGAFQGRNHIICPWAKPAKKEMPKPMAQYNDGHSYIRARGTIDCNIAYFDVFFSGEHSFAQLYCWGVCRNMFKKRGNSESDRLNKVVVCSVSI